MEFEPKKALSRKCCWYIFSMYIINNLNMFLFCMCDRCVKIYGIGVEYKFFLNSKPIFEI